MIAFVVIWLVCGVWALREVFASGTVNGETLSEAGENFEANAPQEEVTKALWLGILFIVLVVLSGPIGAGVVVLGLHRQ